MLPLRNEYHACGLVMALSVLVASHGAFADKVCLRSSMTKKGAVRNSRIVVPSSSSCPKRTIEIVDTATLVGPVGISGINGVDGQDGADGALRIYGDGSAGALTISVNTSWVTSPPSTANLQFSSVTINPGVTFTVPSGLVFRVKGVFQNGGTLRVSEGAGIGAVTCNGDCNFAHGELARLPAHPGVTSSPAGCGMTTDNTITALGASSTVGMPEATARALLNPGVYGGGGGMQDGLFFSFPGGGGTVVVLAEGGIVNSGGITANGRSQGLTGSSGSGGGIVILASKTSVSNSGDIQAKGSDALAGGFRIGNGGGGGGGIIHLLAPSISNTGTTSVAGGSGRPALPVGGVSTAIRTGGCSGGASGGAGGQGGHVSPNGSGGASEAGDSGYVFESTLDPTAMF